MFTRQNSSSKALDEEYLQFPANNSGYYCLVAFALRNLVQASQKGNYRCLGQVFQSSTNTLPRGHAFEILQLILFMNECHTAHSSGR